MKSVAAILVPSIVLATILLLQPSRASGLDEEHQHKSHKTCSGYCSKCHLSGPPPGCLPANPEALRLNSLEALRLNSLRTNQLINGLSWNVQAHLLKTNRDIELRREQKLLSVVQEAQRRETRRVNGLLSNPTTSKIVRETALQRKAEQDYPLRVAVYLKGWQDTENYYKEVVPASDSIAKPAPKVNAPEEAQAKAKLKLARTLAIAGKLNDSREYLEEIVSRFSGTEPAVEAQRLLADAKALRDFGKD